MPDNRSAFVLIALSMTLLAAGDATVRMLGEQLHVGQVIALRGAVLIALLSIGLVVTGYRFQKKRLFHKWSILRGLAETVSTYCFFFSLQFMPIAISTTVVFIFPIILTLVSIPLYGEQVGPWRWVAVIMGFLGVVLISNPSDGAFEWVLLLPVMTAIALVGRDLATRYIPKDIPAAEVTLTTAIITSFFGFLSFPFGWHTVEPFSIMLLPIAAALVALSFMTYIIAVRKGELSIIAPAQYLVILWATFWGALIWKEYPSNNAVYGGLLIISAGCLILWREYVHQKKAGLPA